MNYPYCICDVFSRERFGGACVVVAEGMIYVDWLGTSALITRFVFRV